MEGEVDAQAILYDCSGKNEHPAITIQRHDDCIFVSMDPNRGGVERRCEEEKGRTPLNGLIRPPWSAIKQFPRCGKTVSLHRPAAVAPSSEQERSLTQEGGYNCDRGQGEDDTNQQSNQWLGCPLQIPRHCRGEAC